MPGRVWDKAVEVATEQHGFITSKNMKEIGENPVLLPQWCKRGLVERAAHGVYRFRQIPATGLTPYMLATLWPAGRGVLSHDTALELHELCDINPDKIHLTLPPSYRYRPLRRGGEQYVIHHETLDATDLAWHEGIRIVTPAAAIRQTIESGVPTYLLRQALDTAGRLGRVRKATLKKLTEYLETRR
jgi:predicted transcriptional regulator of viral defense system